MKYSTDKENVERNIERDFYFQILDGFTNEASWPIYRKKFQMITQALTHRLVSDDTSMRKR